MTDLRTDVVDAGVLAANQVGSHAAGIQGLNGPSVPHDVDYPRNKRAVNHCLADARRCVTRIVTLVRV